MSDKIVLVHEGLAEAIPRDELNRLLDEGWEVKTRRKVKIRGKSVDEYHLYKPSKERGLSVAKDEPRQDRGLATLRHNSDGSVIQAPSNNSFLGTSDFKGLPGLQVGSSMQIEHAFAMGADAAHQGLDASACPWQPGSIAATQWLRGHARANGPKGKPESQDAYNMGALAAKGEEDVEVHCPYPPGTFAYGEWVRGFKEAGGKVV